MQHGMKLGGAASLIQALCYVIGFAMLATVMNPGGSEDWSQAQKLEFVLGRQHLFVAWNIVIYVVFGVALVVLAVVLHRALSASSPLLMSITTPFAFIWSGLVIASGMIANVGLSTVAGLSGRSAERAVDAWTVIGAVQDGLGGGVEVVGGVWVLLLSVASLKTGRVLPRLVNWVGLIVGVTGIATVIPALAGLGAVFGLTQILWFIGVGIALIRSGEARRGDPEDA